MNVRITPTRFEDIRPEVVGHLAALPAAIDSYVEDLVLASTPYRLEIDGADAGFAAVHDGGFVTQFALGDAHKRHGEAMFDRLRHETGARAALVPSCDAVFLAHALVGHRRITVQACLFAALGGPSSRQDRGVRLRPATPDDAETIRRHSGELFAPIERRIADGEVSVTIHDGTAVGFGLIVRGSLLPGTASIGLHTVEEWRGRGLGAATAALLVAECRRLGLRAVAGCARDNVASRRTLERAGMFPSARLLWIES